VAISSSRLIRGARAPRAQQSHQDIDPWDYTKTLTNLTAAQVVVGFGVVPSVANYLGTQGDSAYILPSIFVCQLGLAQVVQLLTGSHQAKYDFATVELVKGIITGLVALALCALVDTMGTSLHSITSPAQELLGAYDSLIKQNGSADKIVLLGEYWLTGCFLAPIIEEQIFRGWALQGIKSIGLKKIGLSSLLFAAIHFSRADFPSLFTLGMVLGGSYAISGGSNVLVPTIGHIVYNSAALVSRVINDVDVTG